ncbi:uncharacterized protein LOC108869705 [Brassica rapa]|uniref:uncharacterized protein LOC108869705 n=1 Tax=Brassica campestris TaxID=3711 RepID=UPI00087273BF|nr:uncharacterized protein LOC108869705 [Brassica rapa]
MSPLFFFLVVNINKQVDEEAINMDPHACYVLRVWGRWAIAGNHLMKIVFSIVKVDLISRPTPTILSSNSDSHQ